MHSSTTSAPNHKSPSLRNYGSSGYAAGRSTYPSHSPSSCSYRKNETSFNDADFSFDFDAISQQSNDILATVDEGLRLDANNVSALYNNAADAYSNNRASIFGGAVSEKTHKLLTKKRLVCLLIPTLALEFARVSVGLLMFLNLKTFFEYDIGDVSLLFSGIIGSFLVHGIAAKLRSIKSTIEQNNKRIILVKYFIIYQLAFIASVSLVLAMSWSIVDVESSGVNQISTLNSTIPEMPSSSIITSLPIVFPVFLMIGYILVTSTTGCGQYIVLSFISHFDSNISPHSASSIIIAWCAVGGTTSGLAGVLATVSNWCPQDECLDHITAYAAILSSITICIASICFVISCSAIYLDHIRDQWERILLYCKTHFFIDPNHHEPHQNEGQRDKTAQEDFDECAGLLEASGHSFVSSQFTAYSVVSQNTLLDTDGANTTDAVSSANVKLYAHQIPVPVPTLKRMLVRKHFLSVAFLVLFISCLGAIFQYYAPLYLGNTVFSYGGTLRNYSLTTAGRDDASVSNGQDNAVPGLKMAYAGTFVYSLVFLVLTLSRKWISNAIGTRFKPWTCPLILLATCVFCIVLIATDAGAVYLVTAFIFGTVRMVESEMIFTVTRRVDRSWPLIEHDITSTPKAFIWSLVPISWVLSTLLVTPLTMTSHNAHAPMVCVTVLGGLLMVAFGFSQIQVL